MDTYEDKQLVPSTEKHTLAVVEASKRLLGWNLHSGFVFRLSDFDFAVINDLSESGSPYTEVDSIAAIVSSGQFFNDRVSKILYVRSLSDENPNGIFLVGTFSFFFSKQPRTLPFDLDSGFDVFWQPLIRSTSKFGVELDNSDQIGNAIEGGGTISFHNDPDFWLPRYDKLVWDKQNICIFSLLDDLPATEAKLLFEGKIKGKSFNPTVVNFTLTDMLNEIRADFPLTDLQDIGGLRITEGLNSAKARQIYGRKFGVQATPVDQVLDAGFPITGTVSIANGSPTITGVGTVFLKEFSPNDVLIIAGEEFTVEDIISDTVLTIGEDFPLTDQSGVSITILPDLPKPYINRKFKVAGHATRQVETTIAAADRLNRFKFASVSDLFEGDELLFGNGERVTIKRVNLLDDTIVTNENVLLFPLPGTTVKKPSAQNLHINNGRRLLFDRDYTYDADLGEITLDDLAEFNTTPTRILNGTVTITDTSRNVTGSATAFESQLKPGYWIRGKGNSEFFEILAIDSDTALRLRTPATYTDTGAAQFRAVEYFDDEEDVLSCDMVGATDDGTRLGNLLLDGPEIVEDLLKKAGLTASLDTASFDSASEIADYQIGFSIPEKFDDTKSITFRDLINKINESIFGSLVQNNVFKFEYKIINPKKSDAALKLDEADVLNFKVDTDNDRVVKTAIVQYLNKEYDFTAGKDSLQTKQKTSDVGQFLIRSKDTRTIPTLLVLAKEAGILANRWAFLLEFGSSTISLRTAMKTARLEVNDLVALSHEKLYERIGGGNRKLSAVQQIKHDGSIVELETEDLSNAFNRCANITANDAKEFDLSTEEEKFFNAYITDDFGMIDNDPETAGLNLIW